MIVLRALVAFLMMASMPVTAVLAGCVDAEPSIAATCDDQGVFPSNCATCASIVVETPEVGAIAPQGRADFAWRTEILAGRATAPDDPPPRSGSTTL